MKTPVLIAACNEAEYIANTLDRLDATQFEPYVIVNGSSDITATIADRYTSNVYELPEMGKLPALQYGLKQLGDVALEPLLLLDADSVPASPPRWARAMRSAIHGEAPAVAAGVIGFHDGAWLDCTVRTVRRRQQARKSQKEADFNATFGANMALNIHSDEILDEILAAPHIWPGEDRYIANVVTRTGRFTQLVTPDSLVLTSARFLPSLRQRLTGGQKAAGQMVIDNYQNRRAPGVTHYYRNGQLHAYDTNKAATSV